MDSNKVQHFFIVGCPRSGTTLLSVLLDRHPNICVTPETDFYIEISPLMSSKDISVLTNLLNNWRRLGELGLNTKEVLDSIEEKKQISSSILFTTILNLYARKHNKKICIEKTPQHLDYIPQILSDFPHTKVICMLRDGRDVALSLVSMPWFSNDINEAANLWKHYTHLMESYQKIFPEQFLIIQYEHLLQQPKETLQTVLSFLGEQLHKEQFDFTKTSRVVLNRSMDWKGNALNSIDISLSHHRRKEKSSQQQLPIIEKILNNELKRYGYN